MAALSVPARAAVPGAAEAEAQALFDEGRTLMTAGRFAEACAKLAESERIGPAIGTAFNLADCYAQTGRPASAWGLFRAVEAEAGRTGQEARMLAARRRADELEPALPMLTVHVISPGADTQVTRDGVIVGRAEWDMAVPVDLGEHVVVATVPARRSWRASVRLERPGDRVSVTVPALEPESALAASIPAAESVPSAPRRPRSRAAVVAAGVGLALLAAAGVTTAVAVSKFRAAGPCEGDFCDTPDAVTQRQRARTLGDVATGLCIGGAVGVVAAVALWLRAPRLDDRASGARPSWVAVGPGGLVVGTTW
jgi:hypothetical protein